MTDQAGTCHVVDSLAAPGVGRDLPHIDISPSSRETFVHSCKKKFKYHKVDRLTCPRTDNYYPWLRFGHVIHALAEHYYRNVHAGIFDGLLGDVLGRKDGIIATIERCLLYMIPPGYETAIDGTYRQVIHNLACFEHDRMARVDSIVDISDPANFQAYVVPALVEQPENDYARAHGIAYRLDVGFLLPAGFLNNRHPAICIGDFKTGAVPWSLDYQTPRAKDETREQMVFPIPWLVLGNSVSIVPDRVVAMYLKKEGGFVYEEVSDSDYLKLYNDLNDIQTALSRDDFPVPVLGKFCGHCEYRFRCINDEGLASRIERKIGLKGDAWAAPL